MTLALAPDSRDRTPDGPRPARHPLGSSRPEVSELITAAHVHTVK